MAKERLKFRCYQCGQLLAVAPSKQGTVIHCPKCEAELLIPRIAQAGVSAGDSGRGAPEPDFRQIFESREETTYTQSSPQPQGPILGDFAEIAAILPAELAKLRPEDVRVEPEFLEQLSQLRAAPPSSPAPAVDVDALKTVGERADSTPSSPVELEPAPVDMQIVPGLAPESASAGPIQVQLSPPAPVPPIEIEPPTIAPEPAVRTVSQVVLPAAVVLAWSVFVLLGLFVAFLAGLMVGHFFWKG